MWLKQIMAYIIAFSATVGINFYLCKFSADDGFVFLIKVDGREVQCGYGVLYLVFVLRI
jgi:hypothetical protein